MDVRLPDGTIIRDVPDGMSKADLTTKLKANGYDMAGLGAPVADTAAPKKGGGVAQTAGNVVAGAVRGAGSIGATLLWPIDKATDLIKGDREMGLSNLVLGTKPVSRNEQRRKDMDAALGGLGAETDSLAYGAGKLAGEVAGTAGAGGAVANVATRLAPKLAAAAPSLIEAIRTSGMSAGGAGLGTRAAGGAVAGAASAGLIDPADMAAGAGVGAVAPTGMKLVGQGMERLGARHASALADKLRAFQANAPRNQTIAQSIDAGYLIPPSSVNPSTKNRILESVSGKQATQQVVSTKNTETTNKLVRAALGVPDDMPLSTATLEGLRKTAGKAYAEVSDLSPQAAADLEALKVARNEATGWFNAFNRSARPDDLVKAKEARALSQTLEDALEKHAEAAGRKELISALRDARKEIAKTYTVGRALNEANGTVDARILGRLYEKGSPLTGELETVGRFGSAFRTAAKSPQEIGSPGVHNLNALASMVLGGGGLYATGDPSGAAAALLPFVTAPAARSMLLRRGAQNALVPRAPQGNRMAELLLSSGDPRALEAFARVAPAIAVSGP
jgi:hypothetical protein